MTNIEKIKQVMRSDREKVNSFCGRTFNRKDKNTYGTAAAEALDLGSVSSPAMSLRRSWTSGKKSSSGK